MPAKTSGGRRTSPRKSMNRVTGTICAALLAGFGVLLMSGCQKSDVSDNNGTRVAVYDIDKVAADLGWASDMDSNMKALATKFKTDFEHSQSIYQDQILKQKAAWAPKDSDKLTPDQLQILNGMKSAAQQLLQQLNQSGIQQLNQYKLQWIQQYRQALRPTLAQVAEDKKLWIILEKTEAVAYNLPSADISDAIVDATRAHPPLITPVPVPQLPAAPTMVVKLPTTGPTTQPGDSATTAPTTAP
jgi:Skp family chaperone for outer membrane proteins